MSNGEKSKLDQILEHLVKQGTALGAISGRLETIETQIKISTEQWIRLSKRQSDLEDHFVTQAGDCSGVMARIADRVSALEQLVSPIPEKFVDDDSGENGSTP